MALQIQTHRSLADHKLVGAIFAILALVLQPLISLNTLAASADTNANGTLTATILSDPSDGNGEYVKLSFSGNGVINLENWHFSDEVTTRYTFSQPRILRDNQTITLCGDKSVVENCEIDYGSARVWNNTGDTLTLFDAKDTSVMMVKYDENPGKNVPVANSQSIDYAPASQYDYSVTTENLDSFTVAEPKTFSVKTATDDPNPPKVNVVSNDGGAGGSYEYKVDDENYQKLGDTAFGGGQPIQFANATSTFRATFETPGTYTAHFEFDNADTNKVIAIKDVEFTVLPDVDSDAPKINNILPNKNDTVYSNTKFSANVSDESGVKSVELTLSKNDFERTISLEKASGDTWSNIVDTRELAGDGDYQLSLKATAKSGQNTVTTFNETRDNYALTVDNSGHNTTISSVTNRVIRGTSLDKNVNLSRARFGEADFTSRVDDFQVSTTQNDDGSYNWQFSAPKTLAANEAKMLEVELTNPKSDDSYPTATKQNVEFATGTDPSNGDDTDDETDTQAGENPGAEVPSNPEVDDPVTDSDTSSLQPLKAIHTVLETREANQLSSRDRNLVAMATNPDVSAPQDTTSSANSTEDSSQSEDTKDSGEVLGTHSSDTLEKTGAISPSSDGWKIFGIAWYWWLLTLTIIGAIVWWLFGARRPRDMKS